MPSTWSVMYPRATSLAFVIIVLSTITTSVNGFSLRDNLESNEVTGRRDTHILPTCRSNSACAFLQANSRGINVEQLCTCAGRRPCALVWDTMDGHSITQGSDQYKFCEKVTPKNRCNPLTIAQTTITEYSKGSGNRASMSMFIHCHCPDHHAYEYLDSEYDETESMELMESTYLCKPLKTCEAGETCRRVTDSPSSYLVMAACACPQGLACPSNTRHAVETVPLDKGSLSTIQCQ